MLQMFSVEMADFSEPYIPLLGTREELILMDKLPKGMENSLWMSDT